MAEPVEYGLTKSDVAALKWVVMRVRSGLFPGLGNGDDGRPRLSGVLLGKPDSTIAKGASGTFSIYSGDTKGSETDTGIDIDAYCRAMSIPSGAWSYLQPVDSGWEAVPAECPEEPEEE